MTTPIEPITGRKYRLLIDGRWQDASTAETFERRNPADGSLVATCPLATREDVDLAIAAARRAFDGGVWPQTGAKERSGLLRATADALRRESDYLTRLLVSEVGKTVREASVEVHMTADVFDYYAGLALDLRGDAISDYVPDTLGLVLKEPVGVVGIITPWNYPLQLAAWKIAPALAVGCTIVIKPSQFTPASTYELGRILLEAGAPPGVVNVVTGKAAVVGERIAASEAVDKVSFTGSTETGRRIMQLAASNVKKISLELGGKSPNIVFADADLDAAVPNALIGVYVNAGQICQAGSRLLLDRKIHDDFLDRFLKFTAALRVGNPADPQTQMGPLVSEGQLERVASYVAAGKEEGAKLVRGGARLGGEPYDRGHFFEPTVFDEARSGMRIAQEEIFGPVLSVITFEDADEALRIANETMYGLAAAIWSKDIDKVMRLVRGIKAGSVWVNSYHGSRIPHMPFGGYKQSGIGRELGREGLEPFLETKSVQIKFA
ncbi:MAG: aldehyde dehydrogenase family protein [Dehalococcoidia bacterium]|nr:aldehyde dehydrogenase family protein [Dehalococcoidia bacterium]